LPTAHLLKVDERFFLIDCGEGTQIQLRRFGYNLVRIHHIFISHLHGDHVFGLFGLLSTMGMMGRTVPVNLYGPAPLEAMMEKHLTYFGPLAFPLLYKAPDPSGELLLYQDEKITVEPIQLKHRTQTFGYLFREKRRTLNLRKERIGELGLGIAELVKIKQGEDHVTPNGRIVPNSELTWPPYRQRSYAYISDTVYDPGVAERVRGVDLLFHEATFANKDEKLALATLHSTSTQAATIARQAGAGHLLIGHFSSRYKDHDFLVDEAREVFEHVDGVNDGDRFSVPLERKTSE
jgi:ribonuclease Z